MIHIADPAPEACLVVALCSKTGFIRDSDARISPDDFDFVSSQHYRGSDCVECVTALSAARGLIERKSQKA